MIVFREDALGFVAGDQGDTVVAAELRDRAARVVVEHVDTCHEQRPFSAGEQSARAVQVGDLVAVDLVQHGLPLGRRGLVLGRGFHPGPE